MGDHRSNSIRKSITSQSERQTGVVCSVPIQRLMREPTLLARIPISIPVTISTSCCSAKESGRGNNQCGKIWHKLAGVSRVPGCFEVWCSHNCLHFSRQCVQTFSINCVPKEFNKFLQKLAFVCLQTKTVMHQTFENDSQITKMISMCFQKRADLEATQNGSQVQRYTFCNLKAIRVIWYFILFESSGPTIIFINVFCKLLSFVNQGKMFL